MTTPSNWHDENGFKFRLFPAKTAKPECLIIYMHGLNGKAEIPYNYLRSLQSKIPGADVIALQAPIKITPSNVFKDPVGYSWFPFGGAVMTQVKTWLSHIFRRLTIAEHVEAFARAQLGKRGLTENNLAYYGHSMGGIVALQAGLSGKKPVAAIVSRGGSVIPLTKVKNKSEVFLQMGELDEIFNTPVPPLPEKGFLKRQFARSAENLSLRHARSVARLRKKKVPLTEKVYPKQGHGQDYDAWNEGVDFMKNALMPPKPAAP